MCFMCDGGTIEEWVARTRAEIQDYGFTMVAVGIGTASWTYTIGLIETFGHPELVVTGLDAHGACVIDALVERIERGERFDTSAPDTEVDGAPLRMGSVHPSQWQRGRFNMWVEYYGARGEPRPQPEAVQLLWSNDGRSVLSAPVAHDVNRPIGRARGRRKKKKGRR